MAPLALLQTLQALMATLSFTYVIRSDPYVIVPKYDVLSQWAVAVAQY